MTKDELDKLAHSLAYETACSALEMASVDAGEDGPWQLLQSDGPELYADCFNYLEARGLLVRHPDHLDWFDIHDESEAK